MLGSLVALLLVLSTPMLADTVVIRAGHLVDPANGRVTDDEMVLVRGGKIVEVGPSVKIPEGAKVVDLSDAWVFPGLMDAHTHLAMGLPPAPPGESLWEIYLLKESTAFRTARDSSWAGSAGGSFYHRAGHRQRRRLCHDRGAAG